jgi:hypothetical protein
MKLTKLTDQSIRDLPLEEHKDKAEVVYFDDEVKRFGLRIRSTKRTWIIQYRRDGVSKKLTIGDAAVIPVARALDAAKKRLAEVTLGGDPQEASNQRGKRRLSQSRPSSRHTSITKRPTRGSAAGRYAPGRTGRSSAISANTGSRCTACPCTRSAGWTSRVPLAT